MNLTLEAQNVNRQRLRNKQLSILVMTAFAVTLGALGYGFDLLTGTVKVIELLTVPLAIILVASLVHNFLKGMVERYSDADSMEYEYFRAVDWIVWTGFVILVWEVFVLGQQFFKSHVLLAIGETFPYGTIAGALLGVVTAFSALQWGAYAILRSFDVQRADARNRSDRVLVEETATLSHAAGVSMPDLFVLRDEAPNAFSVGRSPGHATIVVTQGLLDQLAPDELRAVLAHELSHIRSYDIRPRTCTTALFGSALLVSQWVHHGFSAQSAPTAFLPRLGGFRRLLLVVFWMMTLLVVPFLASVVILMTSRHREYLADISAASITKDPDSLARALVHLERPSLATGVLSHNIAHLCIIDPLGKRMNGKEGFFADVFATHPPTAKRVELLQALSLKQGQNKPVGS